MEKLNDSLPSPKAFSFAINKSWFKQLNALERSARETPVWPPSPRDFPPFFNYGLKVNAEHYVPYENYTVISKKYCRGKDRVD